MESKTLLTSKTMKEIIDRMKNRGIKKFVITKKDGTTDFTVKLEDLMDAYLAGLDPEDLPAFLIGRYKKSV